MFLVLFRVGNGQGRGMSLSFVVGSNPTSTHLVSNFLLLFACNTIASTSLEYISKLSSACTNTCINFTRMEVLFYVIRFTQRY